jgi:hypothetical protein
VPKFGSVGYTFRSTAVKNPAAPGRDVIEMIALEASERRCENPSVQRAESQERLGQTRSTPGRRAHA